MVNCQLRNYFKGRGRKWAWSKAEGGGGVDLALGFKNFWDGVYNFFFCPPLGSRYESNMELHSMDEICIMFAPNMWCSVHTKHAMPYVYQIFVSNMCPVPMRMVILASTLVDFC